MSPSPETDQKDRCMAELEYVVIQLRIFQSHAADMQKIVEGYDQRKTSNEVAQVLSEELVKCAIKNCLHARLPVGKIKKILGEDLSECFKNMF
ncbi:MAG: hypothetical protein V4473_00155 [Patescibacteria group bacterium]